MVKFFYMGNGNLIAVAGRSTTKKALRTLQKKEWARKQGGICNIVEYTSPRAIYYATRKKPKSCKV